MSQWSQFSVPTVSVYTPDNPFPESLTLSIPLEHPPLLSGTSVMFLKSWSTLLLLGLSAGSAVQAAIADWPAAIIGTYNVTFALVAVPESVAYGVSKFRISYFS